MLKLTELIAPCGMNCGICMAYLREKNKCPGCRSNDKDKKPTCIRCVIKNCESLKSALSGFCFECVQYPCQRLKNMDKRYRTKYHMSTLENLENIKTLGLKTFCANEQKRWQCAKCGGVIDIHHDRCSTCGEIPV